MSTMDLNHKGITWVGNLYQKFEAVCQEVDDIVSKDTVKYVGNQLQNVGGSVKKFYSDVVQDVLPPIVDPVKREAQSVALKSNTAINTYLKSMIGGEEMQVDTVIKQSHLEPKAVDHVKNQLPDASNGPHLVDDISTNENPNESTEEYVIEESAPEVLELISPGDKESCEVLTEENVIEESASEVLELISPGDKESCEALISSKFNDDNHENAFGVLAEVSPASSFHSMEFQSSPKMGTVCDSLEDITEVVSDVSSILTSSETAEMSPLSSSSSLLAESFSLSGKSPDNSPSAVSCNNPGDCVCDSSSTVCSSTPAPVISCKNKSVESGLASSSSSILSLESIGWMCILPRSCTCTMYHNGPSSRTLCARLICVYHVHAPVPCTTMVLRLGFSDDLNYDINDPGMETIELCDEVKLDESCVIVEPSELYAVSHRARKFRSYRKKIQDAFGSRKRLVKEYEQLAIWYGGIDMGSSKDGSQPLLPSIPAKPLDSKDLQLEPSYDNEWELL
uniref:Uncharacterized protein n=1 Tax=Fagus sylvatica TaxID=28930 RepID=A0A2N9EYC6_FAGSY